MGEPHRAWVCEWHGAWVVVVFVMWVFSVLLLRLDIVFMSRKDIMKVEVCKNRYYRIGRVVTFMGFYFRLILVQYSD